MADRPWFISILPLSAAISSVLLRQLIDLVSRLWAARKAGCAHRISEVRK